MKGNLNHGRKEHMKVALVAALALASLSAQAQPANDDLTRWQATAARVTIIRDDRGIPHIYGKSDADAVFGMIYAQAEDDFNRVETNYLNSLGRLAEAEGESAIYQDLRQRLFIDDDEMKKLYAQSPAWLKALMTAWADGLNYYLHTHPDVKSRAITRFESWMPLSFSEGSIGGDIERVSVARLKEFYERLGASPKTSAATDDASLVWGEPTGEEPRDLDLEPRGSNGASIAPVNTLNKKALFLINPHTSFYFRSEAQVVSEEGLNAYGASTWGQFFVYQGFNDRLGWMHTSSGIDNIDEYVETIIPRGADLFYLHGGKEGRVQTRKTTIRYKTDKGMASREFTVYRTPHGPITRLASGAEAAQAQGAGTAGARAGTNPQPSGSKWIAVAMMESPLKALTQSYTRTKAKSLKEFRQTLDLHTNSSNNTLYADADGNIAYFHANFAPRRDPKVDWTKPVDGSNPANDWKGVHTVDESPNAINPKVGWVYNTNNWPYSAAGPDSPKRADFPRYMEEGVENPRGVHAIRVLSNRKDFTIDSFIAAAFDPYLPAFADLVPPLVKAWDEADASELKTKLTEPVVALRSWDFKWAGDSIPTALAVFWGEELWRRASENPDDENLTAYERMARKTTPDQKLQALSAAIDRLTKDFGTWRTAWGDINRYQRLTNAIAPAFDDAQPSHPVPFTSALWGSLASFGARAYPNTKKWYGTSGNSFVAVVEFGDRITARAVMAGGQSGNVSSPHFKDQIERYAAGNLRDIYFYRNQLEGHTESTYRPGESRTPAKPASR